MINIPMMMPSRDGLVRLDTIQTILGWQHLLQNQNINLIIVSGVGGNIPRARNACMDAIRDNVDDKIFMGWMDSDMVLPTNEDTIQHLDKMAWTASREKDAIICCDYRTTMENGEFQMRRYRTLGDTNEMLFPVKTQGVFDEDFTDVGYGGASGFGLCFGYFPRDYVFHADRLGEDINFWNDNPDIRLIRYNDFVPGHAKEVIL